MRATRSIQFALVAVAAVSVSVRGQEIAAPRGFLFATGGDDVTSRSSLTLFLDASASAVSDAGLAKQSPIGDADFLVSGLTSQWMGTADYTRARRRTLLVASGRTSYRYLSNLNRVSPISHSGDVGWGLRLPRQSILQLSTGAAYAPSYFYELFPTASPSDEITIPANPDYRILQTNSYSYAAKATARIGAANSPHVIASAERGRTKFDRGFLTRPDLSTSQLRLQLTDPVTPDTAWSVEYQRSTGTYGVDGVTREDRISGTVEYSYALSRTHRVRFHLNAGPGILHVPTSTVFASLPSLAPPDKQPESRGTMQIFKLESDAMIDADLGRRLRGTFNHRRGAEYLALLTKPVFASAVHGEVSGLITRRVEWAAGAGYAKGTSALNPTGEGLRATTTLFRTRYALSRSLATYAEYLHYSFDLRDQTELAPDLPHVFTRHEIRFGGMFIVRPIHRAPKGTNR